MSHGPQRGNSDAQSKAAAAGLLYQQAAQALQTGQLAQAEQLCRRILADFPGNGSALHLLGLVAFRTGHLTDARALIEQSFKQNPNDPDARNSFGVVLLELKERDKALAAFDMALKLRPAHPDTQANRARALLELKRPKDAVAAARQAVGMRPDHFDAWTHLGNGLFEMDQLSEAADAFTRAIALRPTHPGAHTNLARVAVAESDFAKAATGFRRTLELAPQDLEGHIGLGDALNHVGHYADAVLVFENLLRLSPHHPEGLVGLADVLLQLGQNDKAFALYDEALKHHPANVGVRQRVASAYIMGGQKDAAIEMLQATIPLDPENLTTTTMLIETREPGPDDPLISQAERILNGTTHLKVDERTRLQFALGRILLKSTDASRGFAYLNAANGARRTWIDFDSDRSDAFMQSIADQCGPDLFRRLGGAGAPSEMPIFIIGMPRSGTTLVEQILASHPDVWGAGELITINRLVDELPPPRYPAVMATIDAETVKKLGEAYLAENQPMANGRKHLVDKMPGNFINAGLIALALPGARIIHCQRDPVDTCLSCYSLNFSGHQPFCYDQTELGRYWRAYDRLMAHWRTVLPAERFIEVRYEDVVADLETQARRLIDFVGLPWNDACLSFHKTERIVRTASLNQVRKPIYTQSVKRWTRYARHLRPLLKALEIEEPV